MIFLILSVAMCMNPIIMMHGLLSSYEDMSPLIGFIRDVDPDVPIMNFNMYNGLDSLVEIPTQVQQLATLAGQLNSSFDGDLNCVAFSQGCQVMRGYVELYRSRCKTLILVSGPNAGQFGSTDDVPVLKNFSRNEVYHFCYHEISQGHVSVCDYWNDPRPSEHQDYLQNSIWLPTLNGEVYSSGLPTMKENFLQLETLVLIGGPDDGVITPWESAHFGYYDDTATGTVPMQQQYYYLKDSFGLQTLDSRGAIHMFTKAGIGHHQWLKTYEVFQNFIFPFLK